MQSYERVRGMRNWLETKVCQFPPSRSDACVRQRTDFPANACACPSPIAARSFKLAIIEPHVRSSLNGRITAESKAVLKPNTKGQQAECRRTLAAVKSGN
jgi:hypothetical protein